VGRRPGFIPIALWTDPRHVRGVQGELAAMAFLVSRGWQIEAHRFRAGRHDIDLVARRGPLVAFVEVKTRAPSPFGDPSQAVGWRKRRALAWAAEVWRTRHGRPGDLYRFDLVVVRLGPPGAGGIEHCADAWRIG
jgi:putative endonuclease